MAVGGETYAVTPNGRGIESLSYACAEETCTLTMAVDSGEFTFAFGDGHWELGETTRSGPYLVDARAAGLAVAVVLAWRRAPFVLIVGLAAATTALVRAAG